MAGRAELADILICRFGLGKKRSMDIVYAIFEGVSEMISEGETVQIRGFGTFKLKHRIARNGSNPSTGKAMRFEAKDVVHFKPTKD